MTGVLVPSGVAKLKYRVSWDELPEDFPLPDDPVESTAQPLLAAALRESLELIGFLKTNKLVASNLGICATVNKKIVVKAPDWLYAANVLPLEPQRTSRRSYTPRAQGDIPAIVMEFLSETEGGEYSARPYYPYGKLWFYERILEVPIYVIFEPEEGALEVRQLVEGVYQLQEADDRDRYWLAPLNLYLGVWQGTKADRDGYWLRFWDENGNLLLWGAEQIEQERQRAEQERQRAEQLAAYLRSQGIDPDNLPGS
jgi:hypothetical protein